MERPRSGTERTPCCRRAHRPQRADHATSRIGHETAPNRLNRLLPHRAARGGAVLSCIDPRALAPLSRKQGACLLFLLPSGAISPRSTQP
jgi:hypothetical protein